MTVTTGHTGEAARPAPALPLLPAVRRLLPGAAGRVALRLPPGGPLTGAPHRRQVARMLLQEAALSGGGEVFETAGGELLLLGAAGPAAARLAATLAGLVGDAAGPEIWRLPADGPRLLAWAEAASLSPPAAPVPDAAAPGLAGLEPLLEALPLDRVLRRHAILHHAPGAPPLLAARRLRFSRGALAAELGPLAGDADLLRHAEDRLAATLPARLPGPGQDPPDGPLLLPLPLGGPAVPAPRRGLVGVLPLAAAASPAALAATRAALARAGWGLALAGLDAVALRLVPLAALAADLLLLRWSPAMTDRAVVAALRGMPAAKLVLTGCDGPEAMEWGRSQGLNHFAGPHVEALLAAARLAACPARSDRWRGEGCTRAQCAERAAATGPIPRAACRNPGLLARLLPPAAA